MGPLGTKGHAAQAGPCEGGGGRGGSPTPPTREVAGGTGEGGDPERRSSGGHAHAQGNLTSPEGEAGSRSSGTPA